MDITAVGGHPFSTHCLIKYQGRNSGKIHITPLCYSDIGGEVVICGSKGGADEHPAWYLNIRSSPEIELQVATQAFRATWREPVGSEREKMWAFMQACHQEGIAPGHDESDRLSPGFQGIGRHGNPPVLSPKIPWR